MSTTLGADRAGSPRPQLWRVTDQASFTELRASGQRCRVGGISMTWLPPTEEGSPPRAAFAVGRSLGGAVVRNRIRRRLRAALRTLLASDALPGGTYLVGGSRRLATMPWSTLLSDLRGAVREATGTGPPA